MTEEVFQTEPSNVIDLHNFRFEEVVSLIDEFIWSCLQHGFTHASIIHGKGTGSQRVIVHKVLNDHPEVVSYQLAGENWGKTVLTLNKSDYAS